MAHLFENYIVEEEKVNISNIPCIRLIPKNKEGKLKTIIFYHGLGSNKERQRMRGYMLAFAGYQVFIPDSIHHGERDAKYTEDPNEINKYFWEAVLSSIEESEILINSIIEKYEVDLENIYVTGHSMGGFISAGIFAHNDKVKGAAPMNGCFNWESFNEKLFKSVEDLDIEYLGELNKKLDKLDPIKHIDKMKNRDILILHGENDREVNIEPQREFLDEYTKTLNEDTIDMIEYEELGHFVTTGMIEDLIKWLKDRE